MIEYLRNQKKVGFNKIWNMGRGAGVSDIATHVICICTDRGHPINFSAYINPTPNNLPTLDALPYHTIFTIESRVAGYNISRAHD